MKLDKKPFSAAPYMDRAKEILSQMTLSEKVGQLVLSGTVRSLDEDMIRNGQIGAYLNVPDVATANRRQRIAVEESRLGIPLLIGHDVVHGDRTLFPIPLATASSWDMERIEKGEYYAAKEAYAEGINWIYSPMIDVTREPRWGRIAEGAGEDKFFGSCVAQARVRGFQTINPDTNYPYTAACFKHYCGYGLSEAGRDYESCDISERTLHGEYLPVYKAALDAGSISCMSSFNSMNGDPVSGSHYYLTELLRDQWGFEGMVVSDWTSIAELVKHRVAKDDKDAARMGILAGNDMDMHAEVYQKYLEELANEDPAIMEAIDTSVLRVLVAKLAIGLFENPYREEDNLKYFLQPETRAAARDIAAHSMVLLKNEDKLLPLNKAEKKKILLTGPFADERHQAIGLWGGRGHVNDIVTLKNALEVEEGVEVVYIKGCDFELDEESTGSADFEKAAALAAECDAIIYACGEPVHWAGEHGGRVDIDLPQLQNDYLKVLKATGKPLVSVLYTARPLACTTLDELSDAILLNWHSGVECGNAVCDILFDRVGPSGRLPVTFPRATGQIPIYYASYSNGRPRGFDGINRHRDCPDSPLYCFGYGLTYGSVEYGPVKIENPEIKAGDELKASCTVKNTSDVALEEVVQVYFRDYVSSLATPDKLLCDFEKIALAAGEEKTVYFSIPSERFEMVDRKLNRVLEPGEFRLYICGNADQWNGEDFVVVE
ncbi:MAG: glycoside hydrolase family 3 C-terminal domain-containing protein [Clostridia bacterium]|nr:glycoside hydrolase family 3 C-terminal domain-containing protein [Clostridia bacterium]